MINATSGHHCHSDVICYIPDARSQRKQNNIFFSFQTFGAPTIVAHVNGKEEFIFGSDRFPILAMLIGKYLFVFVFSF